MRLQAIHLDQIIGAEGLVPPKGLVHSLNEVGLLHPILVQMVHAHQRQVMTTSGAVWVSAEGMMNPDYKVIAGRKRVAAARELGWTTIPAVVLEGLAPDKQGIVALHENLHRAPSPALEARIIHGLVQQGLSQRQIAKTLGISQAQVSQRLALLTLVPKALDMLERGELKPSIARSLAKLSFAEQQALLAGESPTLAQVQACRRQRKLEALADLPLPPPLGPQPSPGRCESLVTDLKLLVEQCLIHNEECGIWQGPDIPYGTFCPGCRLEEILKKEQ